MAKVVVKLKDPGATFTLPNKTVLTGKQEATLEETDDVKKLIRGGVLEVVERIPVELKKPAKTE